MLGILTLHARANSVGENLTQASFQTGLTMNTNWCHNGNSLVYLVKCA
jgi:hypothetical protein